MRDATVKAGMAKKGGDAGRRLAALLDGAEAKGLSGVVIDRRDDVHYFSGYTGADAVLVAGTRGKRWLVTDARFTEEAEKTAPGFEVVLWRERMPAHVGKMIKKSRMKCVGYTPQSMTAAFFDALGKAAGGTTKWRAVDDDIAQLRSVKSAGEVEAIRAALACAEGAFAAARRRWRVGMAEIDIKNDLEWEMRKRGAEDTAFETIIASGANASLPHAHAGKGTVRPGKMLLVDFGARVGRYNSDLTRTLWPGEVPAVWLKRYSAVLAAQSAGVAAIRAGVTGRDVDAEARKAFSAKGLAERFSHGLGHGVGLAVHEEPRLSRLADRPLRTGNVVTVEPGVYFPGSGGIRVEDMALVEEGGARILSSLPRGVDSIVF